DIRSRVTPRLRSGQEGYKTEAEEYPPLVITGSVLRGITYRMPVASAQVKSAILLAGLYARGRSIISEPVASRDHTERMMKLFGAGIKSKAGKIILTPGKDLVSPQVINVPADISSAAFFLVLATLIPGSLLELANVSLNPLRAGAIKVLRRMGADITVQRLKQDSPSAEPAGDIFVRGARLKGTTITKDEIPSLIDELPILMAAAATASGKTLIKGAQELRVKETDRINSMSYNLKVMGAVINVRAHAAGVDIIIDGVQALTGGKLKSFGDHRTAMSICVAAAAARGASVIDDVTCIDKSFPGFIKAYRSVVETK
ncbi:MAG: 3-phosphoshikimate 1-carboxyvinyltransferase, partial [Candidatus Omnitrophota bacterium]|nr:3-phosphoshikimate 1-carboxyvinyltransferase [Candidatus Omnitrophota bacterium]